MRQPRLLCRRMDLTACLHAYADALSGAPMRRAFDISRASIALIFDSAPVATQFHRSDFDVAVLCLPRRNCDYHQMYISRF